MKKLIVLCLTSAIFFFGCKKNDSLTPVPQEIIPTSKLILVDKDVATSALVSVDSTKLTFSSIASGVDKIKVGSVLVSDMTSVAPDGFLRKVTSISTVGGNKVLTTEQAAQLIKVSKMMICQEQDTEMIHILILDYKVRGEVLFFFLSENYLVKSG